MPAYISPFLCWVYQPTRWAVLVGLWLCAGTVAYADEPTPQVLPEYRRTFQLKTLRQATQQILQARQRLDTVQWIQAHVVAGKASQCLSRYASAVYHFRRALRLAQKDAKLQATTLPLLGKALYAQGDTGNARLVYQRALINFQRQHNSVGSGEVYQQLGELYGSENQWRRAQTCHEQALQVWRTAHDSARIAGSLHDIGRAHHQQQQNSRALYYLQQSQAIAQHLHDSVRIGEALRSTGQIYQDFGNFETAAVFYTQALENLPQSASPVVRATTWWVLAAMHDSLDQHGPAQASLQQALVAARQAGSSVLLRNIYFSLSSIHQRDRHPTAALQALQRYVALQDSALVEQRENQIAELQLRYESEKKEREIQLLTKDQQLQQANLRRQKLLRNLLAAGAVLLLMTVGALYRAHKQQEDINRMLKRKNAAISQQKEVLDRLNQTKNTLFSVISHDLRSPLSSLYSLLSLLSLGTLPPARLAAHAARLSQTLDSTSRLLDNLLNWSASQMQGDGGTKPERLRLDVLIAEALDLMADDAERKQVRLINEVQEPCPARADLNMTRLILRNLLGNALKFTPAGGTITVSAKLLPTMWEIAVHDTGVGISPTGQYKIQEQRESYSTPGTDHEKGVGLGLRLCKEFLERNSGELSFESTLGKGSIFRFTLPAAESKAPKVSMRVLSPEDADETVASASVAG
ncbi:tetratricopeptide repeat-containing sensor histidine kinase [Hymenobacter wooponensis]|uniref:histidine kinase n=1 Tax=Hymenobacter wooponensis TaxID=1525360 RepID=A0A4Z0MSL0_9BACT|nr:tetratricopeptide repeat protein [Hymenobacter wooponensis]TGD82661.1 tetratricopeptide repeat protein [Hymenobacter wooponensis]